MRAALSQSQELDVIRATAPLNATQRAAFMRALEEQLRGRSFVGEGELFRLLKDLQRKTFKYPDVREHGASHSAKTEKGYVK
jgi:hypothetical protein